MPAATAQARTRAGWDAMTKAVSIQLNHGWTRMNTD